MMFKVGDKVIPVTKKGEEALCAYGNKVKNGELKFLYVVGYSEIFEYYILNETTIEYQKEIGEIELDRDNGSGNYYLKEDLKLYINGLEGAIKLI